MELGAKPSLAGRQVLWVNEIAAFTGGCERYVFETARLLAERGVRSSLFYSVAADTEPAFTRGFEQAYPMVDLPRQLAEVQPDLIYVHRLSGSPPMQALTAGTAPVVRFFHDHRLFCLREHKYTTLGQHTCRRPIGWACYPCLGFVNRSGAWPGFRLTTTGMLRREQRAQQGCAAWVVGSAYMSDHLAAHGFERARIHTLPLYAAPPPPAAPSQRDPHLLLFAGQLVRGKGLDLLLDALARVSVPARLVVLGSGRQEAEYRAQASRLGLDGRVSFLGRVDARVLADHYRRAAALVFPSRSPETFGLVGPEAMSHATPVIATAVGGTGEWLLDGVTGIAVPAGDVAGLAGAIDRLLGDPELARRMGEAGFQEHERRFRPEQHVDGLLALFRGLLARGDE